MLMVKICLDNELQLSCALIKTYSVLLKKFLKGW